MRRDFKYFDDDMRKKAKGLDAAFSKKIPHVAGNTLRNGFKKSFRLGKFNDNGSVTWVEPKRKQGGDFPPPTRSHKTRRTLIGKSGGGMSGLKDSFEIKLGSNKVTVSNTKKYAAIHNEGGQITTRVTEKYRKFAWAMYYKTGHDSWKGLALTKKSTITVTIPKRQFMGDSRTILREVQEEIDTIIDEILKK